jgi:hypothetical protein
VPEVCHPGRSPCLRDSSRREARRSSAQGQQLRDGALETIRRAAALEPPLPADDAALWLAAAGALIAMREPSGLDPELEAAVMALELADWLGAVVGLVRGGVGANAEPAALVALPDGNRRCEADMLASA